jgi:hypothetical protein
LGRSEIRIWILGTEVQFRPKSNYPNPTFANKTLFWRDNFFFVEFWDEFY